MTPEKARILAPMLQAFSEGKAIQYRCLSTAYPEWEDYDPDESYTFYLDSFDIEWRVKPTPREWVLGEFHQPANGQHWKVLFDTMGEASKATSQLSSGTVYTLTRVVEAPL